MEIKNKLADNRGGDRMWEVGRAGENNGGKMGTTVIEQQQQNKGTYFSRLG